MNAQEMLIKNGKITVSDLMIHDESLTRHQARHACEALVEKGLANKTKEGQKVFYNIVFDGAAIVEVPAEAAVVLKHIRTAKARSVGTVARLAGLTKPEAADLLTKLVAAGKVAKVFGKRFRLAGALRS